MVQLCGVVEGRVLIRYVRPVAPLSMDSGSCASRPWIDDPTLPTCPFKANCKAYHHPVDPAAVEAAGATGASLVAI